MSESPHLLALPRQPVPTESEGPVQRWGRELRQLLRQLRVAPQETRVGLCLQLRERLETARTSLLGSSSRIPEPLRHYAVSLTEVQWLLDAWIAGGEDETQLRHDFFEAASRLFDDEELDQAPSRPPTWWMRCWTMLCPRLQAAGRAVGRLGVRALVPPDRLV